MAEDQRKGDRRKDGGKPVTKAEHDKAHKRTIIYGGVGVAVLLVAYLWWRSNSSSSAASTAATAPDTTGDIPGPAGPAGARGSSGPKGARGARGAKGPAGTSGKQPTKTPKSHSPATSRATPGKAGITPNTQRVAHTAPTKTTHSGGTGVKSGAVATHRPIKIAPQAVNAQRKNIYGNTP